MFHADCTNIVPTAFLSERSRNSCVLFRRVNLVLEMSAFCQRLLAWRGSKCLETLKMCGKKWRFKKNHTAWPYKDINSSVVWTESKQKTHRRLQTIEMRRTPSSKPNQIIAIFKLLLFSPTLTHCYREIYSFLVETNTTKSIFHTNTASQTDQPYKVSGADKP